MEMKLIVSLAALITLSLMQAEELFPNFIKGQVKIPGQPWEQTVHRYNAARYGITMEGENGDIVEWYKNGSNRRVDVSSCLRFCISHADARGFNIKLGDRCECVKVGIVGGMGNRGKLNTQPAFRHYYYGSLAADEIVPEENSKNIQIDRKLL